jgi:hypothetical protein
MPHLFTLAQGNSTSIRNRKDTEGAHSLEILWKVDWRIEPSGKVLTDVCVSENKSLDELISRFIENKWQLGSTEGAFQGQGITVGDLDIFLVNYQKQEVKVEYQMTLREAMRDQAILEYPTFIIRERIDAVSET